MSKIELKHYFEKSAFHCFILHLCTTMHGALNIKSGSKCCYLLFVWKYDNVNPGILVIFCFWTNFS